nr:MAG TPA: hypothetical protein [Caudoviricetes sp.]
MALRMFCVADWVNYYLYDYTDILTTLPQLAAPGVVEENAPLMAWWRQWAAEGGSRRA